MQQPGPEAVSAREAAALLGVKAQTLYAYASRGLLRRIGTGKRRLYVVEDLERLQARQRARAGHGPVAAAALSFGEPVLDTRITSIDEGGPRYRGISALEIAERGASFEAVAELLWSGELPQSAPRWSALPGARPRRAAPPAGLEDLLTEFADLTRRARDRHVRVRELELALGRQLVRSLAGLLAPSAGPCDPSASIAELLAPHGQLRQPSIVSALNAALVLLADHELNASSFAARIAASTDAHLPACLLAALATLSGPRHGGACDRVEALLDEAASLAHPADVVEKRARRGDQVPGFGHPLYPKGDPRGRLLLQQARHLASTSSHARKRLAPALVLAEHQEPQGLPATVDFGLVALSRAAGFPPGFASLLFALGRSAGWVAHVLEQRASGAVLRPRARYVGA
jgi:citrate synthase